MFGLLDEDLCYQDAEPPPIELGQRASDIVLARKVAEGDVHTVWFDRHECRFTRDIPSEWPQGYGTLVERRIQVIRDNARIGLIETPEYKRRWSTEPMDAIRRREIRDSLLGRLESARYWPSAKLTSCAALAELVGDDREFIRAGELYRDTHDFDSVGLVTELAEETSVPFGAVLRYSHGGLRKRSLWETTWALQRREDAIDERTKLESHAPHHLSPRAAALLKKKEVGEIPVPPRYKSTDFSSSSIWRLRGKLDVPKEQFISFPYCERAADPSPVILWAGFNHLQRAQAIASYYLEMKEQEGWSRERLVPLLAGLMELVPWVKQWHNEPDPEHGERMGDYFETFVDDEAKAHSVTLEDIRGWTPPSKKTARKKKSKATG